MAINKRLFGAPIQGKVREKLEVRQTSTGVLENNNKTPFVRMWTNVRFLSNETFSVPDKKTIDNQTFDNAMEENEPPKKEVQESITEDDFKKVYNNLIDTKYKPSTNLIDINTKEDILLNGGGGGTLYNNARDHLIQTQNYDIGGNQPEQEGTVNLDELEFPDKNKIIPSYIFPMFATKPIVNPAALNGNQLQIARKYDASKTYVIGNDNYKEYISVKDANTNKPIEDDYRTINQDESVITNEAFKSVLPETSAKNPYMKPPAGITSINSATDGGLGLIKITTVEFMVHNFYDFDKIYSKFFLKPGAQIFVDFGWSTISNLYNPDDLIAYADLNPKGGIEEFLYAEKEVDNEGNTINDFEGEITKYNGDLETIFGMVTDYDATVEKNGSVKCSITITSTNSTLLNTSNNKKFENNMIQALEEGFYYYCLKKLALATTNEEDNKQFESKWFPYGDTSSEEYQNQKQGLVEDFATTFGKTNSINRLGTQFGVYAGTENNDMDPYITWGMFEDYLINGYLGFGKGHSDINHGKNFQVRLDSSESYTSWSYVHQLVFKERLRGGKSPMVLIPEKWGLFSDGGENYTSYSYRVKKYPEYNETANHYLEDTNNNNTLELGRVPLREIFIRMADIKLAFKNSNNKSIQEIIHNILESINEETNYLFDWGMIVGNTDSQVKIIDKNYAIKKEIHDKGIDFFRFNVMSPNSQIIDYNLGFKLPSGNLGDYYAINGMSHENSIFTVDKSVRDAVSAISIDLDSINISYQPDLGGYRAQQNLNSDNTSHNTNIYNKIDDLMQTDNLYTLDDLVVTGEVVELSNQNKKNKENGGSDSNSEAGQSIPIDYLKANNMNMRVNNFQVAQDYKEYLKFLQGSQVNKRGVGLLPYTLDLKINGISSIVPGDTFKVSYLPEAYRNKTFSQTMKVEHNINSDGWYTTLQTQFRELFPSLKNNIFKNLDVANDTVRLSADGLATNPFNIERQGIGPFLYSKSEGKFDVAKFEFLKKFITEAKLNLGYNGYFDYVFDIKLDYVPEITKKYNPHLGHLPEGRDNGNKAKFSCVGFLPFGMDESAYNEALEHAASLGLTTNEFYSKANTSFLSGYQYNNKDRDIRGGDLLIPDVTFNGKAGGGAVSVQRYSYVIGLGNAYLINNQKYKLIIKNGLYGLIGPFSDDVSEAEQQSNTQLIIKSKTQVENILKFYDYFIDNKPPLLPNTNQMLVEEINGNVSY